MYETASPTGYGLILALLVVLAGGAIVLGEEYWSETHTPQNGTVEAKSYDAPKSRLLSSRDEVYRLKISNGDKEGDVEVPGNIWEQAEVGDWYDAGSGKLEKAEGEASAQGDGAETDVAVQSHCPSCGAAAGEGDAFYRSCGKRLAEG